MAEFKVSIKSMWEAETGAYQQFLEGDEMEEDEMEEEAE